LTPNPRANRASDAKRQMQMQVSPLLTNANTYFGFEATTAQRRKGDPIKIIIIISAIIMQDAANELQIGKAFAKLPKPMRLSIYWFR